MVALRDYDLIELLGRRKITIIAVSFEIKIEELKVIKIINSNAYNKVT